MNEAIEEILEHIDFDKIYQAMKATDWSWYFGIRGDNRMYGIPNIRTIKDEAARLLKHAYENKDQISSGGFRAGFDGETLSLDFVMSEWDVDIEEGIK